MVFEVSKHPFSIDDAVSNTYEKAPPPLRDRPPEERTGSEAAMAECYSDGRTGSDSIESKQSLRRSSSVGGVVEGCVFSFESCAAGAKRLAKMVSDTIMVSLIHMTPSLAFELRILPSCFEDRDDAVFNAGVSDSIVDAKLDANFTRIGHEVTLIDDVETGSSGVVG